jgi:hypothetical protein
MNFVPIKLEVEQSIREYAIGEILKQGEPKKEFTQYPVDHTNIPYDLLNTINLELNSKGIPDLLYAKSYVRKKKHVQEIHVDGILYPFHCSINIPLKGSAGSRFCYYTGSYKMIPSRIDNLKFFTLQWDGVPILEDEVELNSAHLVRIDKPHSAIANDTEDRWIFTMRFKGNPTFEELYQKITNEIKDDK